MDGQRDTSAQYELLILSNVNPKIHRSLGEKKNSILSFILLKGHWKYGMSFWRYIIRQLNSYLDVFGGIGRLIL